MFLCSLDNQVKIKNIKLMLTELMVTVWGDVCPQVCNVSCTGEKSYEMHVSGAKHQKVGRACCTI